MTIRAAAYGRTSNLGASAARSLEDQRSRAITYAGRQGFVSTEFFSDHSTACGDRAGLAALLAAAQRREFGVLIVDVLDRLSRDPEDLEGIAQGLLAAGLEIHIVSENLIAIPGALPAWKTN